MSQRPLISIVLPCFNEEACLPALFEELEAFFAGRPEYRFEVVAVDDGSSDGTLAWLRRRSAELPFLRVLALARNFGSHPALMAGLRASRGDAVTFLAADLQDPPELAGRLADAWVGPEEGPDVVWARKTSREDGPLVRATSRLAHRLFAWLTGLQVPPEGLEIFLADRRAVDAVCAERWRNCSLIMAFFWAGFPSHTVDYAKRGRGAGQSKWTLGQRFRLFVDTTVGFSYLPMRLMSALGAASALAGFAYALLIFANRLFLGGQPPGWASLMVVLLVIGGLLLLSNGILGEYLWRTLEESRKRPMYLIRRIYGDSEEGEGEGEGSTGS